MIFNKVQGKNLQNWLASAESEAEVEDIYKDAYKDVAGNNVHTIKKKIPNSRAHTDGLMECKLNGNTFYGIQEVKHKKSTTDWQIKQQLIQALMYDWLLQTRGNHPEAKFYIMNSEKMFTYVFSKDIEDIKAQLWEIFPTISESPCVAYKNPKVQAVVRNATISYQKTLISDQFELDEKIKDIYNQAA